MSIKNIIKRGASLLVGAAMVVSMAATSFAYDVNNDIKGTSLEDAATVLGALKIMIGDDEGNFRPNDGIRRSEFAKVAVHLLGLEGSAETSKGITKFGDVEAGHWANGYINIATEQRVIIGDDLGNFRPDERISYQDANTILVRLLGYEPAAEAKGGYPTGYLSAANQYGLTKNASGSSTEEALRGVSAMLAYNALTINQMQQTGFGTNTSYEITEKTILEENLKTVKKAGQVTGNYFTKLTGTSGILKDEIEIDGVVYKNADKKAGNKLGARVNYFVKTHDNDDQEIVLVKDEGTKNKSLTIDGDNITTVAADKLNYWVNKEKDNDTKIAKISSEAKMIFNGVAVEFDHEKIGSEGTFNGNITLLDNTQDDTYDVVFVNEYKNLVVESTSTLSHTVSDKYGAPSLQFDPDNTNVKFTLQDKNGNNFAFTDLEEWMVISYIKSADESVLIATVNDAKAAGKVTEQSEDKFKIDGTFYKVAQSYLETENKVKLDDQGTFYLDIRGNIAAVDATSTLLNNYAYMMNAAETTGMSDTLDIKVYNSNGETKVMRTADKVSLNGANKVAAKSILPALKNEGAVKKQLITYDTNAAGEITKLSIATDKTGDGVVVDKDKFVLNYKNEKAAYKSASNKLGGLTLDSNTIIFDIPATAKDEDDYSIKTYEMFENDGEYDVEIYDLAENLAAKVVMVKAGIGITNPESPIAVINRIAKTTNAKDEAVEKLYAARNGEMIEIETATAGVLVNEDGEALKAGDIIQYRTNAQGAIDKIRVLFEAKDKTEQFMMPEDGSKAELRIVYGQVDKKFANSINVSVNGSNPENFVIDGAKVISVDTSKSSNVVSLATAGDIQRYDALSPRLVFLRIYKDEVKEVVIVK